MSQKPGKGGPEKGGDQSRKNQESEEEAAEEVAENAAEKLVEAEEQSDSMGAGKERPTPEIAPEPSCFSCLDSGEECWVCDNPGPIYVRSTPEIAPEPSCSSCLDSGEECVDCNNTGFSYECSTLETSSEPSCSTLETSSEPSCSLFAKSSDEMIPVNDEERDTNKSGEESYTEESTDDTGDMIKVDGVDSDKEEDEEKPGCGTKTVMYLMHGCCCSVS